MQGWIEKETATATFGTMKSQTAEARKSKPRKSKPRKSKARNERLRRRFQMVLDAMSQKPSLKFPAACRGSAEVQGATPVNMVIVL
jgi:hypothetical protein